MFLFEKSLIQSTPLYSDTLVTVVLSELSRVISLCESTRNMRQEATTPIFTIYTVKM